MRKMLSFLVALVLLGAFTQVILMYFMPYVALITRSVGQGQILGILVLFIPIVIFVVIHRLVMGIVDKLLYRKGEW